MMYPSRWSCLAVLMALAFGNGRAMGELHIAWRSGASRSIPKDAGDTARDIAALSVDASTRHIVIQFRESIGPAKRAALVEAGVTPLKYLGDNAFFASISADGVNASALEAVPSLAYAARIDAAWKLAPRLAAGAEPSWAVVDRTATGGPVIGAYVLFHKDVPLVPTAAAVVRRHGANVRDELRSLNGLVIELAMSRIPALAREDAVAYIEAAMPRMGKLNNSSRALMGADLVQAAPYGLDGSGVHVVVYDDGAARRADGAIHPDLAGRLTMRDASPASAHASHVAGTLGGDGTMSGGAWRGMAPGVSMLSYGFEHDGSGTFLYSNPGDLEWDYTDAISLFGADLANNSIGTKVCANSGPPFFLPCSMTGDYGVTSALIDAIVRGSLGVRFRSIWANGNERNCPECPDEQVDGYHSTAPPACAKNHIGVGAVSSDVDVVTSFSSWGPCDDGRIKPDVCGPGCQVGADNGVTSCDTGTGAFGYATRSGTSMAAPAVSGLSALLLQDYRARFSNRQEFRNSTLKTFLTHCAVDADQDGPDYRCGYGSVRIQRTIDFMRTGGFLEEQIDHQEVLSRLVVVYPGDPVLKATLAWDDEEGAPNVSHALVNDLDLRVFDEASVEYFPWTLDSVNPAAPARRDRRDHDNNIEQVLINAPAPGVYRIEVHGFNVPFGPQEFSLCATPAMVTITSQGSLSLDKPQYLTGDSAIIQVADRDLNTSDQGLDTVTVTVSSSTDPVGKAVVLSEFAPDRAVLRGAVALNATGGPGALAVAVGDTITATYVDANDGAGGTNLVVTQAAVVVPRTLFVSLQVGAIYSLVTRNMTFVLTDCTGQTVETIVVPVSFDVDGLATIVLVPTHPSAQWISADGSHTLRRLLPLASPWPANISFVGLDRLLSGDFNGDDIIDVQDLSILGSIFNSTGNAADTNGDGLADSIDFTAVSVNFFSISDPVDGCGP